MKAAIYDPCERSSSSVWTTTKATVVEYIRYCLPNRLPKKRI